MLVFPPEIIFWVEEVEVVSYCTAWAPQLSALQQSYSPTISELCSADSDTPEWHTAELDTLHISLLTLLSTAMELLLRQNTFDIHKPPGGGLFDREYLHLLFFSRRLPACQLASSRYENFVFNTDHVIVMTWSVGEQIISIPHCSVFSFDRL